MAGDRRATMGNIIAQRDIEKVFPADEYSCVGIAGTAGLAVEMVRLFQTELEHYEKIEGTHALDGRQGQPARRPDPRQPRRWPCRASPWCRCSPATTSTTEQGRIFSYDVTGGRYEETAFHSVGSGSLFARGSLKKLYREDLTADECVTAVVAGALRRRRRRLRHRRPRPDPADLPGRPGDHRRRRPPAPRRRGRRDRRPGDRRPDEPARRPGRGPDLEREARRR